MNIIEEVFNRYHPIRKKLKDFGFVKKGKTFQYKTNFKNDGFEAIITIDDQDNIEGKVIDLDLNEEYKNIYSDSFYGSFVGEVREEYISILEGIRDKCFEKDAFLNKQSKRIAEYIQKEYKAKPEFLWKRYPNYAVFRNKDNAKWFAIIMNVEGSKFNREKGETEIIDVKTDRNTIASLVGGDGYYEAYHMNKDNWISIVLDETVPDEIICAMIDYSYNQLETSDAWIIPANPEYYDVINCFNNTDTIIWKQSSDIHIGDIVYMYVAKPYSAILYKCLVEETDIPYEFRNKNLSMNRVMRLSLLKRYKENKYTFEYLNSIGIRAIRGPRRINKQISEKLS